MINELIKFNTETYILKFERDTWNAHVTIDNRMGVIFKLNLVLVIYGIEHRII